MAECTHLGCQVINDGECHVDADGWMINVTREQHERICERVGAPNDDLGIAARRAADYGRDLVQSLLQMIADPKISNTNRRAAEKQLERLRLAGVPREAWKEH